MASAMLNNGAPLSLIQDLLGHTNVNTTKKVYAAYEQQTLRKGFEQYNPSATRQVADLEPLRDVRQDVLGAELSDIDRHKPERRHL